MQMQNKMSKTSFLGAAIGTMVEYYDYALFIIFLPILAPLFFPADTAYQSLVKGYFILLVSMIARPIGGLFFGYLGDMVGRRKALLGSMYGISLATMIVGITPTYSTIGVWAIVIMILSKTTQMFCFGGEYNGAGIYVVEHAQNKNEAFVGIVLTLRWMPAWSWRMAFIIGGIIGIFGIIYRKNLLESPCFQKADIKEHTLWHLIKHYPKELLTGVFIGGLATAPFTTVLTFINPVLMTKGYFTSHQLMLLQTFFSFIAIATLIPIGAIADKKSPKKVMQWSCLAFILFSYFIFRIVDHGYLYNMVAALTVLIMLNEVFLGPSNAYLKNLFPVQFRYRGASLGFCIGMSFIGGLTPVIENYLYQWGGGFHLISIWLGCIALGTLIMMQIVKSR